MKQERSEDRIGETMGRNGTLPIFEGGMSLHKRLKVTFNAPVTLGFVIMCFIATLLGVISNGKITQIVFMTYWLESFYWKCIISFASRSHVRRKIWFKRVN